MSSTESAFGVTQPGDPDYPIKTTQGGAGTIDAIRSSCTKDAPYEDPDFPPNDTSIGKVKGDSAKDKEKAARKYVWLRPHELCTNAGAGKPQFAVAQPGACGVTDDASQRCTGVDVRQGGLGDCWYMAALATLTANPEQFNIVVPVDNYGGFEDGAYCGAFHFRFYDMGAGKYADVVIDDLIPCNAETKQPAFAHVFSSDDTMNEFWPVLVEKAFAKFRGSYRALEGGHASDGLQYLTGGFAGKFLLQEYQESPKYEELLKKVKRYISAKQFLDIGSQHPGDLEAMGFTRDSFLELGLRLKHDYSVLGGEEVAEKDNPDNVHYLLKIKNPWGHHEWKGKFSDGDDANWGLMARDLRARTAAGSADVDEGVFWMDFRDVTKYLKTLYYCLYGLDGGTQFCSVRSEWPASLQEQKINYTDRKAFHFAPAFSFEVRREIMAIEIPEEHEGKCVAAMRIVAGAAGRHLKPVPKFMYYIYDIQDGDDLTNLAEIYKRREQVTYGGSTSKSEFVNVLGLYLTPGRYFVTVVLRTDDSGPIPEDYVGQAIPFVVSLYSENQTSLKQIN